MVSAIGLPPKASEVAGPLRLLLVCGLAGVRCGTDRRGGGPDKRTLPLYAQARWATRTSDVAPEDERNFNFRALRGERGLFACIRGAVEG